MCMAQFARSCGGGVRALTRVGELNAGGGGGGYGVMVVVALLVVVLVVPRSESQGERAPFVLLVGTPVRIVSFVRIPRKKQQRVLVCGGVL